MPKVGRKHFPYTAAGKRAAKEESGRTGVPVEKGYKKGGAVKKSKGSKGTKNVMRGTGAAVRGTKFSGVF